MPACVINVDLSVIFLVIALTMLVKEVLDTYGTCHFKNSFADIVSWVCRG